MPDSPVNLSRFWQELKRRKVLKTMAMYAATAFIIIEAVDIMLPRLGLPDWTVTFVIVLLIVGFPVAIIFSWIFDLTGKGLEKTESMDETVEPVTESESGKRRLKVSDVIIGILLVLVCILLYPKLFNKDRFESIRDDQGKISVAVMPFENLSGDSLFNVWQGGFQNLLISTLSNSRELEVRQYHTISDLLSQKARLNQASFTGSAASEIALSLDTRTFIAGKILKAGNRVRVNAQLVNAETEEIYKTYQIEGNSEEGFFEMADSLTSLIRNYLEIKNLGEGFNSPDINESITTKSPEAFQYYIHAWDALEKMDLLSTIEWLSKAIETDSGFIEAQIFLSFVYVPFGDNMQSKIWCNRAYSKRDALPIRQKLQLDHLYAYHYKTALEEIKICRQILEMDEMSTTYWHFLGEAHYKMKQFREASEYFEKVLEIHTQWGTNFSNPYFYYWLGDSYHQLGDHKKEREVYETGLGIIADDINLIRRQASCALSQGETEKAERYLEKLKSAGAARNWSEAQILARLGYCYWRAGHLAEAEEYCRHAASLEPDNPYMIHSLAWLLIDEDLNIDEGMKLLEKALKAMPDDSDMLDTWGWGLYKQGKYDEALKALRRSWELRSWYSQTIKDHIVAAEQALQRE
ncbi:MAG: tetratricopeptide repeat protein [Bacteroidota bacterium]